MMLRMSPKIKGALLMVAFLSFHVISMPSLIWLKGGKSNKTRKKKRSGALTSVELNKMVVNQGDLDELHSEDISRIREWTKEYHEKRPGFKILEQMIDDFIVAKEEQEEQARKEREAKMAEEGWTVVVHHKGGKKTTDPGSRVAVGSVAEAAVLDKLANKKSKDVGLDFYRFQKKEAQRSEIMKLQSKFEEDKKRIQQLRAARKFRPY